jgi:Zn-dependent metalloprotease
VKNVRRHRHTEGQGRARSARRGCRCRCFIVPPHILENLAASNDPRLRAAGTGTLIATSGLRVQRNLLGLAAVRGSSRTGVLRRTIYDAQQGAQLPGKLVRGEASASSSELAVDQAYDASGDTYAFYDQVFGRKSVDGRGMRLDSTVRYREDPAEPFDNAFWNGEQMVYGDGDGQVFGGFTGSLDVIAHELTHGVTDFEAGLEYHNQSGALNESMSDVFGSMARQWKRRETVTSADWLIGKELLLIPGSALRSMKEPGHAYDNDVMGRDPQPDRMSRFVHLADTRRGDWGGVHVNSGIANRAFYLACVNLAAPFSWERAGKIWYTVLTTRLGTTSSFIDAANATVTLAGELFGPVEAQAVRTAWQEVEVLPRSTAVAVAVPPIAATAIAVPPSAMAKPPAP